MITPVARDWNDEQKALIASLRSSVCPGCGKHKNPGKTICWICFSRLPKALRQPLYRKVGAGYEEAHAAAMQALKGGGD